MTRSTPPATPLSLRGLALAAGFTLACAASPFALAQEWDTILGDVMEMPEPDAHWVSVRGRHIAYMLDADAGEVMGTLTLSMFTPAILPDLDRGLIYTYGSFYSRTYYGDRLDLVQVYDLKTATVIDEIEIPAKAAGIGHSGMINLINDRFVGVWNITPGSSISIVDIVDREFIGEISTPGCAALYPTAEGFITPCADGTWQYIALDDDGMEASRTNSASFFEIAVDPVYDYAVPSDNGWLFLSMDGLVFDVTVEDGEVVVAEPWSINPADTDTRIANGLIPEKDDSWRIGGRQPFAYSADKQLLVTIMHEGGGQETFEDAGEEIWGFSTKTKRRGFRLEMDEGIKAASVQITTDADPLLIVAPDEGDTLQIRGATTGHLLREVEQLSGSIQNLY